MFYFLYFTNHSISNYQPLPQNLMCWARIISDETDHLVHVSLRKEKTLKLQTSNKWLMIITYCPTEQEKIQKDFLNCAPIITLHLRFKHVNPQSSHLLPDPVLLWTDVCTLMCTQFKKKKQGARPTRAQAVATVLVRSSVSNPIHVKHAQVQMSITIMVHCI